MNKTIRITPDYIRKIISEEQKVIAEHQRYKKILFLEGKRLRLEGHSREIINEQLMDIIMGLGEEFIKTFKKDLANILMSFIGIDTTGVLAQAFANVIEEADILDFKKYFTPGGCDDLSGLIVRALGETAVEPVADSIVATLGIQPQSRIYETFRERLVTSLFEGEIATEIQMSIREFVCGIDVSDIFGSFRQTVFSGGGGGGGAVQPQLVGPPE